MATNKRVKLNQVDEVLIDTLKPESFFNDYIKTRTPCKFKNNLQDCNSEIFPYKQFELRGTKEKHGRFIRQLLEDVEPLMVEQKSGNGFGNGNERVRMSFRQLIEKFQAGDDNYYLTTQYEENEHEHDDGDDDDDDEENDEEDEENDDGDEENDDKYELDQEFEQSIPKSTPNPLEQKSAIPEYNEDDSDSDEFDFDNLKDDYEPDDDEEQDEQNNDEEENKSGEESARRLRELFQPPLTTLHKDIPLQLPLFNTLVPQQINLWMGYNNPSNQETQKKAFKNLEGTPLDQLSPEALGKLVDVNGTSSGLHHDHSDNLYILVSGIKRFTLFSPFDAYKLYTVGNILNIYQNGVINYKSDEQAPSWKFINDDGSIMLNTDSPTSGGEKVLMSNISSQLLALDPPNFSQIPPLLLHLQQLKNQDLLSKLTKFVAKYFPELATLDKYEVWLKPGDMLYLPSSWFHEVSSFPDDTDSTKATHALSNVHLAINYWFAPPNNDSYSMPYKDDYWYKDFNITKRIIDG